MTWMILQTPLAGSLQRLISRPCRPLPGQRRRLGPPCRVSSPLGRDCRFQLVRTAFEKSTKGSNETRRSLGLNSIAITQSEGVVKLCRQLFFVVGYDDPALRTEALRGGNLMVVAGFAKIRAPGHYDNRLAPFERCNNRSHSRVRHDDTGFLHDPVEVRRFDKVRELDVLGTKHGTGDLGKYVGTGAQTGPFVDGTDQAIERLL